MADLSQIPTDQLLQMLQQHPAIAQPQPQSQLMPQSQTWREQLMAGPVGQAMGGAMQGVYGLDQAAYKGAGALTSGFGHYPNQVSDFLNNTGNDIGNQAKLSEQTYDRARQMSGQSGANVGKFAGEVLSPANLVAGEAELPAATLPYLGRGAKLAQALFKGGAYGGTSPVDPDEDYAKTKAEQIGLGAGIGAAGHGLASAANPMGSLSKNVVTLLKAGVPLTVGQTLGGAAHTLEDSATSIPFVGDMIKSRQREAMAGLQTAMINRSLTPIGEKLPSGLTGHDAIQYAQQKFDDHYDSTLSQIAATADPQLTGDLSSIVQNATRDYGLNQTGQKNLYSLLHGQVIQKSDSGYFDGDALKDVQSGLRFQAQRLSKSLNPDDKNLADALFDARDKFNDFIARQNPAQAPQLQAINKGYASYARAEAAGARSNTGISTPAQLLQAVKAGGTRATNAAGNSLDQDLATAGTSVLPSTVPDSGTAGRHMVGLLAGALAGGGEHLATGDAGLGILSSGAALAAGASRPAQALGRAIIAKRPYSQNTAATLADLLRSGVPLLGAPAGAIASSNPGPK